MANENSGWLKLSGGVPPTRPRADALRVNSAPRTASAQATPTVPPPAPGAPEHSQTVGPRGPALMQDTVLHETMESFANAPFLRRAVHTKGYGAFGYFSPAASMRDYTQAGFLSDPSVRTQVAARFSLAAGDGSVPDTSRNIRGLSVKFYTDSGVYDLLCNSIPVFFVRDAIKVPETIAALGPSPVNNLPDPNQVWGMFARTPEATNMLTWFFSDAGTAKSFRTLSYHSVSTYVWKNAQGVRRYVKYRWVPVLGEAYISAAEAAQLACENPNIAGQELYNTIAAGRPTEFDLYVQLMDPVDAASLPYDPLDDTKIWDDRAYPPVPVGRLTLNRNPADYHTEVEQLAFAPANLVEGIELSDDKMLQGRAIVYSDAQRHRLGDGFRKLPINRQADWTPAAMADSGDGRFIEGEIGRNAIPKQSDFAQAGERYNAMTQQQRRNLTDNLAAELTPVSAASRAAVLGYLNEASPQLAAQVRQRLVQNGRVRRG